MGLTVLSLVAEQAPEILVVFSCDSSFDDRPFSPVYLIQNTRGGGGGGGGR